MIGRREFITLLGGAASWPLVARAQQPALPVVGYFYPGLEDAVLTPAFRKGLGELGFVEGRNVAIEYRFGRNDPSRTPELVADLVRRRVAVIAATGGSTGVFAAKAATTTIPDPDQRIAAAAGPRGRSESAVVCRIWRQRHRPVRSENSRHP